MNELRNRYEISAELFAYVLHGKRKPSERLARALKRMGIEVGVE